MRRARRARPLGLAMSLVAACAVACGSSSDPAPEPDLPLPGRTASADAGNDALPPPADAGAPLDAGDDAAADAGAGKRVFVSSVTRGGNLKGLFGADLLCRGLAGNLGGKWVAWLSVSGGPHAIDRVTSNGPFRLLTGELVAADKAQLATGSLTHAIDVDEKGAQVVNGVHVWTGTGPNGSFLDADCSGWTSGGTGRVGSVLGADPTWTSVADDSCNLGRRLYCFEL